MKLCFCYFVLSATSSGLLAFAPVQLSSWRRNPNGGSNGLKSHQDDDIINQLSTNEDAALAELHQRSLLAARLSFESRGSVPSDNNIKEESTGDDTEGTVNRIKQEMWDDSTQKEQQQQQQQQRSLLSTKLAMEAMEAEKQLVQEQTADQPPVTETVEAYALYEEWLKSQSSPTASAISSEVTTNTEETSLTHVVEDISSEQTSEDIVEAMNSNDSQQEDSLVSMEHLEKDVSKSLEEAWPNVDRKSIQKSKKERVAKIDQFLNKAKSLREAMLAEANSLKDQTATKEKDLKREYGTSWTPSITLTNTKTIDDSLEKAKVLRDAMLAQAIALKEKTQKEEERIQKLKEDAAREAEELARAALANAKAKEEARAKAMAEAEVRAKEEAEAKLRAEVANAKAKEEAKARAKAKAEAKEREEAEAKNRAEKAREEAQHSARAAEEEEAKAREIAEAEAKAREIAEAEAMSRAIMKEKQRAQEEAEAKAREFAAAKLKSEVEIGIEENTQSQAKSSYLNDKMNDAGLVTVQENLMNKDLTDTDEIRLQEIEEELLAEMTDVEDETETVDEDSAYLLHQQWLKEEEGIEEKEEEKDVTVEDDLKSQVRLLAKERLENEKEEEARLAQEQKLKDEEKRKRVEAEKARAIEQQRLQEEEKARLIAWDQESNKNKKRFISKEDEWAQWMADEPNNVPQQKKKSESKTKPSVRISWMGGNNAFDVDWTETLNVGSSEQNLHFETKDEPERNESIDWNESLGDDSIIQGTANVEESQHVNEVGEGNDVEIPTESRTIDSRETVEDYLGIDDTLTDIEEMSSSHKDKENKKGFDEIIDMVGSVVVQRHLYRFSPTEGAFQSPFVFEDRQFFKVQADKSLSRFGERSFILRQIAPSKSKNKYSVQLGPAILGIDGLKDDLELQEESRESSWQTAYAAALYCMMHPRLMSGKGLGLSSGVGNVGILSILGTAFVNPGLSVMEGDFSSLVPIPKRLSKFVMTDGDESNILKCIENLEASSFPSNRVNLGVYDLSQKVPRDMRNSFDFILSAATSNFNGLARTMAFALKPTKSDFMTKERTQGQFLHVQRGTRKAVDDLLRTLQSDYKMKFRVDTMLLEKLNLTPLVFSTEEEAETNFREEVESSSTGDVRIEHVEALPYTSTAGYHDEGYTGDNGEYFFPGGGFL